MPYSVRLRTMKVIGNSNITLKIVFQCVQGLPLAMFLYLVLAQEHFKYLNPIYVQ